MAQICEAANELQKWVNICLTYLDLYPCLAKLNIECFMLIRKCLLNTISFKTKILTLTLFHIQTLSDDTVA